jgi:hypothetical protein
VTLWPVARGNATLKRSFIVTLAAQVSISRIQFLMFIFNCVEAKRLS